MPAKYWVSAAVLAAVWLLETYLPFFRQFGGRWTARLRHDGLNLLVGGVNAAISAVVVVGVFVALDRWSEAANFGLLRQFPLPPVVLLTLSLLLFDLWMYWWHRLNHKVPFLWRFHRTHHSDPQVDASTGVRFHTGEIILSWLARAAVLPVLGMQLTALALYETMSLAVVLFHHSNIRLPKSLDYGLLVVVVTPAMHRVHHSRVPAETNSNYASLLPWWDWLFGSLRLRPDVERIRYGLEPFDEPNWQTLGGVIRTPFVTPEDENSPTNG